MTYNSSNGQEKQELNAADQAVLETLVNPDSADTKQYDYGEDFQRRILAFVTSSPDRFERNQDYLKPDYFTSEFHKRIARLYASHYKEFGCLPDSQIAKEEIRKWGLPRASEFLIVAELERLTLEYTEKDFEQTAYLEKQICEFDKRQVYIRGLLRINEQTKKHGMDGAASALTELAQKMNDQETEPVDKEKWKIYSIKDLSTLPPLEPLVDGFFNLGNWVNIFASSGSGKTFLALDTALSIATGKALHDIHKVKRGPVVYLATEGFRGFQKRIYAWLEYYKQPYPENFHLIIDAFNFMDPDHGQILISKIKEACIEPVALYVDTLSLNFGAGNDKESVDMNAYVSTLKPVINEFNCTLFNIHHCGWAAISHERGASNLRDVADTSIGLERHSENPHENKHSTVKCWKQRDTDPFAPFAIEKTPVQTACGSSCVWLPTAMPKDEKEEKEDNLNDFINWFPNTSETALSLSQVMDLPQVQIYDWSESTVKRMINKAEAGARHPRLELVKGSSRNQFSPNKWFRV